MDLRGNSFGGGGFYRNKAISTVQDKERFYRGDGDYGDVNVGEGFHQTFRGGNDAGKFPPGVEYRREPSPPPRPVPLPACMYIPTCMKYVRCIFTYLWKRELCICDGAFSIIY